VNWFDKTLDSTSAAPGTLLAPKFPQQRQEILKLNVNSLLPSVWPASVSIRQCKNNQAICTTPYAITVQLLSLSFF
jgi:hypothetical protein